MSKIATSKGVLDIDYESQRPTATGEVYIVCPICTPERKSEHRNERKLAINKKKDPIPWRCNHCGEGGYILTDKYMTSAKIKPLLQNFHGLKISDGISQWFWNKRRIGVETLRHFDVTMNEESIRQDKVKPENAHTKDKYISRKCINFKYKMHKVLVNIKFRDPDKNFKMLPGASLIPYNIDAVLSKKVTECVIVEGEIDALSYHEAGVANVISAPNGIAISIQEKEEFERTGKMNVISHANLEWLDLVYDDLDHIEIFYLATDDDPAGIKLREELARRLGYERCRYICFSEYQNSEGHPINDPNELLVEKGAEVLASTLDSAHMFPITDVTTADQYVDIMLKNYHDGKQKGISTGYVTLNPFFNWMRGWLYVVNGMPNMGKTSFVLNLMAISAVKYKWKWGIYCPENYPVSNIIELLSMILIGKTIDSGYDKRISEIELIRVVRDFISKYFFLVDNQDGFTPDALRKIKKRLVEQHGIIGFLTDPWSSLNHDLGRFGSEDGYLQDQLNHEVRLTTKYNLINIVCHHPRTPKSKSEANEPPSVFELTGGKYWWIKSYSAITIHQESYDNWMDNMVGIHVQKMKDKQRAGETTNKSNYPLLKYDKLSRRFYESETSAKSEKREDYKRFPFKNYLETEQQNMFEGF